MQICAEQRRNIKKKAPETELYFILYQILKFLSSSAKIKVSSLM